MNVCCQYKKIINNLLLGVAIGGLCQAGLISAAPKEKSPASSGSITISKPFPRLFQGPVVLRGSDIKPAINFKLEQYGLYKIGPDGFAVPISFQIDEKKNGDYIMTQSSGKKLPRTDTGKFDIDDEICFRGRDIGPATYDVKWKTKPSLFWQIIFRNETTKLEGSVLLAVFMRGKPDINNYKALTFDHQRGVIDTNTFVLKFNPKNHILFDSLSVRDADNPGVLHTIFNDSAFMFIGKIRFFFNVYVTEKDLRTELDFWKSGPIRWIGRINIFFKLMGMNLDINMYTELAAFEDAIALPTTMNFPMDAKSMFAKGSGIYYGLKFKKQLRDWKQQTTMVKFTSIGDQSVGMRTVQEKIKDGFWLNANRDEMRFQLKMLICENLVKDGAEPLLHAETNPRDWLEDLNTNVGLFLSTEQLGEGSYKMSFYMRMGNRDQSIDGQLKVLQVKMRR